MYDPFGCFARVSRLNPSGESRTDIKKKTAAFSNGMETVNAQDDCMKAFTFPGACK